MVRSLIYNNLTEGGVTRSTHHFHDLIEVPLLNAVKLVNYIPFGYEIVNNTVSFVFLLT